MSPKLKFSFGAINQVKICVDSLIMKIIFVTFAHSEKLAVLAETVHFNGADDSTVALACGLCGYSSGAL